MSTTEDELARARAALNRSLEREAATVGEAPPASAPSATQQMIDDIAARIQSGEMELPPEAYGEGETSEVTDLPPPNRLKWYRCKKGHWQQGEFIMASRNPFSGAYSWRSGNVCSTCLAQYQAKKFPTEEKTPSAELLARFERMANPDPERRPS
jgi:hypothetical protein